VVDGGVEGGGCEEAVVDEGAFEDAVHEEVEGMPDEEDAKGFGGCGGEDA